MQIYGRCTISLTTGIITGKISPQTEIVTASTDCIFLSGNKEVTPLLSLGLEQLFQVVMVEPK